MEDAWVWWWGRKEQGGAGGGGPFQMGLLPGIIMTNSTARVDDVAH